MRNNILVIENTTSRISEQFKCKKLEYNNQSKDDIIHEWLIKNKHLLSDVEKLIIPIRLSAEDAEYTGLYIGLHIRLTKELEEFRFLPILFISEDTSEDVLSNQIKNGKAKSGLLLFTKGSYLISAFSLDEFISKSLSPINEQILLETVISNLIIDNSRDLGHQLANDWGAFRLAKFAGCSLEVEKPRSLYFKYTDSITNNNDLPESNTNIGLFDESCNALLIDDNANSGWSEVLSNILKTKIVRHGRSVSLDVIESFEDAMAFANYLHYDVIFLDLRLSKLEDSNIKINSISDFTGTQILKRIKDINRGIQVIIFTASNKVWNVVKLLEMGANGYYIKESPEFILSNEFSKENYKEFLQTVEKALSNKFMRDVDIVHRECIKYISLNRSSKIKAYNRFYDRTISSLEIANQLLDKATSDKKYLNFAYLTYYQIVEDFVNQRENFDFVSKKEAYVGSSRIRVVDDSSGELVWKLSFFPDGNYFELSDEVKQGETPIQTLAKVSFVLAFMFQKNNSYLKQWANVNNIRNTKAAHGGANGYVTIENIKEMLEIVKTILSK